MANRQHYISVLLQCIFFESAATVDEGECYELSLEELARSMDDFADLCSNYNYNLTIPCNIYVYRHSLNTEYGVGNLIDECNHDPDFYDLFPHWCTRETDYYGQEVIQIPGLSQSDINQFLWDYAENVPFDFQDDIATVICYLREVTWLSKGSGGASMNLPHRDDDPAVQKFTRAHNEAKLSRNQQRQQEMQRQKDQAERQRQKDEAERQRAQEIQRQWKEAAQRLTENLAAINVNMISLENSTMSTQQRDSDVSSISGTLQQGLQDELDDSGLSVGILGSFANGLSLQNSDVDLTLLDPGNWLTVKRLGNALWRIGYERVQVIRNAKVPIVTFWDPWNGVPCDISINQAAAIENSKLIKTYVNIDDRVRTIWFSLKAIAKGHRILSAKNGFLSSYALTLMLINYLQSVGTPVLPALQQQLPRRMVYKKVDGYDCTYDHNWSNHRAAAKMNTSTASELLLGFLSYFGSTFDYGLWEVNSRLGQIRARPTATKIIGQGKQQIRQDEFICVMDPFETSRNVAGMVRGRNVVAIKKAFQDAHDALKKGDWSLALHPQD
ncbi:hypothetical protein BGZ54_002075 [Gamsiella multidivaricata]|nr:hypothetical protein BGZ54_002075 [Gamsiella multidivaricata]